MRQTHAHVDLTHTHIHTLQLKAQIGETRALNTEMLHEVKMLNERVVSLERGVATAAAVVAATADDREPPTVESWQRQF